MFPLWGFSYRLNGWQKTESDCIVMDDNRIRNAALSEISRRAKFLGNPLSWDEIVAPFEVDGEEILLANRARGIFKPRQMKRGVLSVKTTVPRSGRERRYVDDCRGEIFEYAFQGEDPDSHDNRRLREMFEDRAPFIYFFGIAPGQYEVLSPAFVTEWLPHKLKVMIEVGNPTESLEQKIMRVAEDERKYSTYEAQNRVHQSKFRAIVLDAYGSRCALSGLPVRELLHAAHIFPDGHERGISSVNNGIALSTLHHAAYDSRLLGISPDGVVCVSDQLKSQSDGPLLEQGLKELDGRKMRFPLERDFLPDREALAYRFEQFVELSRC